ncbi:MAG: TraR/DksA C4-type zinc finger protein [bacterium]|nr:TraR/DksA C4-type zinc finger protein [bacterium]
MTDPERARWKQRLEALRDETIGRDPARIEPNRTDHASTSDEDAQALSEMHQVLASKRNQGQAERLREIAGALDRLARDPDLFGLCADCEEPILPARLEAIPWTSRCASCQERLDPRRSATRKSLTDFS